MNIKNLGVFDPLKHLINGFRTWYMSTSPEEYSFLGDSDYWAESWFIFKEQVEISSPLVYLFYIGYLPESLWLAYKENKQGTFKQVEQEAIEKGRLVENQGEMFDGWDWSETDLYQPKWVEGKKSLEQFCLTVLEDFPPQYSVEVLNPDYWVSYHLYSEEEARSLIEHITTYGIPKLISPISPAASPNLPAPIPAHPMSEPHKFISTPISRAIPGVLGISDTPWK